MKVLALGAAGAMGRAALRSVAARPPWTTLTVADRDELAARDVAALLPAATGRAIDAADQPALRRLLAEHDVVVSTIGPYYRFGDGVLGLAIETGTHYLDICDDWQPTVQMLERHQEAQDAGITAVLGAGASPGISNLLAVVAAQQLDETRQLFTGWGTAGLGLVAEPTTSDGGTADAAYEHWVAQSVGTIRVRHAGVDGEIRPLSTVALDIPGSGRIVGRTVGHPEPVTLPLTYPELEDCMNVMDMPSGLIALLERERDEVEAGRQSVRDAAQRLAGLDREGLRSPLFARFGLGVLRDVASRRRFAPELHALAIGTLAGVPTSVSASLGRSIPGGMAPLTGIPLAVILTLLIEGHITRRGVMAPEACVDPAQFFRRLLPHATKEVAPVGPGVVRLHSTNPSLTGAWSGELGVGAGVAAA